MYWKQNGKILVDAYGHAINCNECPCGDDCLTIVRDAIILRQEAAGTAGGINDSTDYTLAQLIAAANAAAVSYYETNSFSSGSTFPSLLPSDYASDAETCEELKTLVNAMKTIVSLGSVPTSYWSRYVYYGYGSVQGTWHFDEDLGIYVLDTECSLSDAYTAAQSAWGGTGGTGGDYYRDVAAMRSPRKDAYDCFSGKDVKASVTANAGYANVLYKTRSGTHIDSIDRSVKAYCKYVDPTSGTYDSLGAGKTKDNYYLEFTEDVGTSQVGGTSNMLGSTAMPTGADPGKPPACTALTQKLGFSTQQTILILWDFPTI